jgi:tetratricopeptide (TPR) repeat protein
MTLADTLETAVALRTEGKSEEAERALSVFEEDDALAEGEVSVYGLVALAALAGERGETERVRALLDLAEDAAVGTTDEALVLVRIASAELAVAAREPDEARALLEETLADLDRDSPLRARVLAALAPVSPAQDADALLTAALDAEPDAGLRRASLLEQLAAARMAAQPRDLGEIEALLEEAIGIYRAWLGDAHPATAGVLVHLANASMLKKDYDGARAVYRTALAILHDAEPTAWTIAARNGLAAALHALGRTSEAIAHLSKYAETSPELAAALERLQKL